MAHQVALIPGDGIGPEVCDGARLALEATGVRFEWDVLELGAEAYARDGAAVLDRVVESVRARGVALKGPTSTPSGEGRRSINIALRQQLDLYAGVRPCRAHPGVPTPFPRTDLIVVRMNHEDLYAGIEYGRDERATAELRRLVRETREVELPDDAGISLKPLSATASERIARFAFEHARANGRRKVTAVHKATVMRSTDGLFLEACRAVAPAYPEIELQERLVDTLCHQLVVRPEEYDLLLLPAMYGDIVSDIGAGLVGGLGMAPGANFGDDVAVFEAVHGSAPRRAGQGRANPFAVMLSGAMMLRHLGEQSAASRLEGAIGDVLREGRTITYDLRRAAGDSPAASTAEAAQAVVERLG